MKLFHSKPNTLTLSSSPFLAALPGSATEENSAGKRAVVFIWLLFISLCRYGSKFRELFLNDPASKGNPLSKNTQNISPLTNPKWKPFIVHNSKLFLLSWLQISCYAVCQSPQSAGGSGTVRGGGWAEESLFSEHSGNRSEGGRYFPIYKNAELAGFFSYALSDICLREWYAPSELLWPSCSWLYHSAFKLFSV